MKATSAIAAFAVGIQAAALRRDADCCFEITASGGVSGIMGQLSDGQNRINGSYPAATYCINSAGGITDSNDRGCILTPSVEQFQCDAGASPTTGFSIASSGQIEYNGNDQFYACPATDTEYNVYTTPVTGQLKCVAVTLSTGGQCGSQVASSSSSSYLSATSSMQSGTCTPVTQYVTVTVTPECATSPATSEVMSTTSSVAMSTNAASTATSVYSVQTESTSISLATYSASSVYSSLATYSASSVYSSPTSVTTTPESTATVALPSSTAWSSVIVETPSIYSSSTSVTTTPESTATVALPSSIAWSSVIVETPSIYSSPTSVTTTPESTATVALPSSTAWSSVIAGTPSIYSSSIASSSVITRSVVSSTVLVSSVSPTPSTQTVEYTTTPESSSTSIRTNTTTWVWSTTSTSAESTLTTYAVSTAIVSTTATPASATSTPTTSTCQTSLSGAYQTPHLIVPISSESPDTAYGTSYYGQINSTESTIFNFDIPESYAEMTCSVIFLFPLKSELETSSYTFNQAGDLVFSELSSVASESTTWNTVPSVESQLNSIAIEEGNSYVVATSSCQAGTTVSIELSSANNLTLWFFEDWNPSSLGLYITAC